jgi:hypothetical protein
MISRQVKDERRSVNPSGVGDDVNACHLWKSQPWNHQHWQPADVPARSQLYKLLSQQYFADHSIFPCKREYPKLSIENSLKLHQLVLASLPLP